MVSKIESNKELRFRFKGLVDLDSLYKNVQNWMSSHGYLFDESVHKFKPPELELSWVGERKNTGYRKTILKLEFHFWDYKEVLVKKDGVEKTMVSCHFIVDISGCQEYDYENKYTSDFMKKLQNFMHRFILYYKINVIWDDEPYNEIYQLLDVVKSVTKPSIG
ncbi:hypothetical protein KY334_00820 [Candidatus Woesearchaeota archaeon]|nr:hypothetical protein [Candidatus Woesearchaeota archaeon]